MKKNIIISLIVLGGLALIALGYFAKPLTQLLYKAQVIVRINDTTITDNDLKSEMDFLRVSESTPFSNITREDVLDRMINDVLIMNEAKQLNISVSTAKVREYADLFWKNYSSEERVRILNDNSLSMAAWELLIKKRMLIEKTISRAVEDQVHVGQDEIKEYYWTHLLEFYQQARVFARQIVLETKEQADTLKKQLDNKGDFQKLAAQYSRGPEKDQGGSLGWVTTNDLPKAFTKVLFKMKQGKISNPVATEYGYHIFYVEKRERGGKIPLNEAKELIADKLKLSKTDRVFQAWLEELRAQAKIIILNH